ncbi:MAG: glycoside hydrolase family 3 N-terminal domain-containing protein, partial [Bacteroidota bacterium]
MKKILAISLLNFLLMTSISAQLTNAATERAIDQLLSKMTLEEKIGQMHQQHWRDNSIEAETVTLDPQILDDLQAGKVGAMINATSVAHAKLAQNAAMKSRLKIPLLFGYDVIHGYKTMFPMPMAEACSWNPSLIEQAAQVAAREAAASGINWTFAPMVDISRDPRWGRLIEGAGEDPYLGSK